MLALAYRAGAIAAGALEPGGVFLGPAQAADAAGFRRDPIARQLFITAYLASLPCPIQTGNGNRIIRIGKPMTTKIGVRELALRAMRERKAAESMAEPSRPDRRTAAAQALDAATSRTAAAPVKKSKKKRRG